MSNTCKVCRHPKRRYIEREIRAGSPSRDIALLAGGISHMSVERHGHGCMPAALALALQREGRLPCGDEIAQAREMLGLVTKIAQDAANTSDRGAKAIAIRAALGVIPFLRTIAEMRGDMAPEGQTQVNLLTINVVGATDWMARRAIEVPAEVLPAGGNGNGQGETDGNGVEGDHG